MGKIPFALDLSNTDGLSEGRNNLSVVGFVIMRVRKSTGVYLLRVGASAHPFSPFILSWGE